MSRKHYIISVVLVCTVLALFWLSPSLQVIENQSQVNTDKALVQPLSPNLMTQQTAKPILSTDKSASLANQRAAQLSIERIKQLSEQSQLQTSLVEDHDNFKRYPENNVAISEHNNNPISQRYAIDERTTINKEKTHSLTVWSDKKYYLANDQVWVYAVFQDDQGNRINSDLSASLLINEQDTGKALNFSAVNSDGQYVMQFSLADYAQGSGIYKINIRNRQFNIIDSVTFTLSQPDIELTGEFKDHIDAQGNLLIDAQVRISHDSQFYIQASLYSLTQVPIGISQLSQKLSAGEHWITLNFSGLMIQDAQENGPYVLQQVSLAKVTMPMQRAPLLENQYTTSSYRLEEFAGQ